MSALDIRPTPIRNTIAPITTRGVLVTINIIARFSNAIMEPIPAKSDSMNMTITPNTDTKEFIIKALLF